MASTPTGRIPAGPPTAVDMVVVGAGPAGSAAAYHAARAGFDVLVVDRQRLPRDKTCGDGLTPRAIAELASMDLTPGDLPGDRPINRGLKLHGFGGSVTAPWPAGHFPDVGTAVPRTQLDAVLLAAAVTAGARRADGHGVVDVSRHGATVTSVTLQGPGSTALGPGSTSVVSCRWLIVADGVRSPVGRMLGRHWHRDQVFGTAARSYCASDRDREAWIHSHLELRDPSGQAQPGYGWVFPLGGGQVNLGAGSLSTSARPARVNVTSLLRTYADGLREEWSLGQPEAIASALLPMGGAVSRVAGRNWALIGDAAACINPLNGEGIDYALETGRLAVSLLTDVAGGRDGLQHSWPALLSRRYGTAFSLARRLAGLLTRPGLLAAVGPLGLASPVAPVLMGAAARLMGNLVDDADVDLVSRLWRTAGGLSRTVDARPPWS